MAGLVGEERLAALPASAREAIVHRSDVVRAEVPAFIEFAPTAADLARLADVALVATVGSTSPSWRQLAAAVLGERAGATGGGHRRRPPPPPTGGPRGLREGHPGRRRRPLTVGNLRLPPSARW